MPSQNVISPPAGGIPDDMADRRLQTPVREFMRPGVIALSEDASLRQAELVMVRHGVHAVLVLGRTTARPLGWVTARGMLAWMNHDLGLVPVSRGIAETASYIEPGATAQEAVDALSADGVSHLLVSRKAGETPQGVVADLDVIALCTRERR